MCMADTSNFSLYIFTLINVGLLLVRHSITGAIQESPEWFSHLVSTFSRWRLGSFSDNVGPFLSIDEADAGDLRTIITNKQARGRKGSIVAIVKGPHIEDVSSVLLKLPRCLHYRVKEITLDMAPNIEKIAWECFPPPVWWRIIFMFISCFTGQYKIYGYKIAGKR